MQCVVLPEQHTALYSMICCYERFL